MLPGIITVAWLTFLLPETVTETPLPPCHTHLYTHTHTGGL